MYSALEHKKQLGFLAKYPLDTKNREYLYNAMSEIEDIFNYHLKKEQTQIKKTIAGELAEQFNDKINESNEIQIFSGNSKWLKIIKF